MRGLAERIRAVVDAPDPGEIAQLRAQLRGLPAHSAPTDARVAAIHRIVVEALNDTRALFEQALDALPEQATARGYLELAEKSLLHAEELTEQARALSREAIDFGTG